MRLPDDLTGMRITTRVGESLTVMSDVTTVARSWRDVPHRMIWAESDAGGRVQVWEADIAGWEPTHGGV